jgi:hypothetical protein
MAMDSSSSSSALINLLIILDLIIAAASCTIISHLLHHAGRRPRLRGQIDPLLHVPARCRKLQLPWKLESAPSALLLIMMPLWSASVLPMVMIGWIRQSDPYC